MTMLVELPSRKTVPLDILELEVTGGCQLTCTHCLSSSSPQGTHGAMTPANWESVVTDAAALGIPTVQLIGGEPTMYPQWIPLTQLALTLGLKVEIYSNLYHVRPQWWDVFTQDGVSLGTSYYSDVPDEHDKITGKAGSYLRTRFNIEHAVSLGISIRAGIVEVLVGQRVAEARAELLEMGVTRINTDRARAVGRASIPGQSPTLDEMCGRCTRGRAAVLPNGDLAGCVLSRNFPAGNVREQRLADLLSGPAWADLSARIPLPARGACGPDDSDACDPSNNACDPTDD
ncbi:radical SAM protein [Streptomyces sp. NPDC059479]|uniref:radical SAM protein n=1 Tax=Streptomyces sp. NPDC059479 TaxID=3346848 RepID=UPI00369C9288